MTGKTHIAIGVTVGLILSIEEPLEAKSIFIISAVIGSLIPDLDHPNSKLNQKILIFNNKFYSTIFYCLLGTIFFYIGTNKNNPTFSLLGIIGVLIGLSTHRGLTHSLVGLFLFSWTMKFIAEQYNMHDAYTGFILGYMLHLLADFFTIKGIRLFFPLNIYVASPLVLNPNKAYEDFLFNILCLLSVYLLIKDIPL